MFDRSSEKATVRGRYASTRRWSGRRPPYFRRVRILLAARPHRRSAYRPRELCVTTTASSTQSRPEDGNLAEDQRSGHIGGTVHEPGALGSEGGRRRHDSRRTGTPPPGKSASRRQAGTTRTTGLRVRVQGQGGAD